MPKLTHLLLLLLPWLPAAVLAQSASPHEQQQALSTERSRKGAQEPTEETAALRPPKLLADSPAVFPPGLQGVEGEVSLELQVDEHGQVSEINVVQSPHEQLSRAAQEAAASLAFSPAMQGDQPVAVRLNFVYRFEAPRPHPLSAKLSGVVRARGTRRAMEDAALFVDGSSEPARTDAHGRFSLDLAPGEHTVEVHAPGHARQTFRENLHEGQQLVVLYRLQPLAFHSYETVVRDERPRKELSRITLREQELREVPGTQGDPFRVVMLMPGVGSIASGISYPVVRGSQPAATGFFLDGVRLPMLYHLLLGSAVVHPDFVESLDFYPGLPPVQYGRIQGGVVSGQLRRPHEDRLHVTAYADLINSGLFFEQPISGLAPI